MAIRLLLVEDDADWVKAMTTFLQYEADLKVVGSAANGDEAIQLAQQVDFDVILLDIHLKGSDKDGIAIAIELFTLLEAKPKIIMLTSVEDDAAMKRAFTAGAMQYVSKSQYQTLPSLIRHTYHHPQAMEVLLQEFARLKREELLQPLTEAEREVYELIEEGHTQSQMTKKLFKSESTLKTQVNRILKKLGVRSSKEAVEKVQRRGLHDKQE